MLQTSGRLLALWVIITHCSMIDVMTCRRCVNTARTAAFVVQYAAARSRCFGFQLKRRNFSILLNDQMISLHGRP